LCLIYLSHQHETCFMSPFWHPKLWWGAYIFLENLCTAATGPLTNTIMHTSCSLPRTGPNDYSDLLWCSLPCYLVAYMQFLSLKCY
jgi:hypothetical protein